MFDPTIFENLKIACENQIYDLDNLTGEIEVTNRIDLMDMATMSRDFAIQFNLTDQNEITAEIRLKASLKDLAEELLEIADGTPGCSISISIYKKITNVQEECKRIEEVLKDIWKDEIEINQILHFNYKQEHSFYNNSINLIFNRKINEEQIGDLPELIDHVLISLNQLNC